MWLDAMKATGTWKPVNNKVHIISEQTGYNQTILKAAKESIAKSGWELAGDTQIQYPVNDWGPVIQELKKVGAGAIMSPGSQIRALTAKNASPNRITMSIGKIVVRRKSKI